MPKTDGDNSLMKEDKPNNQDLKEKNFLYGFGTVVSLTISTMGNVSATVSACFGPSSSGKST